MLHSGGFSTTSIHLFYSINVPFNNANKNENKTNMMALLVAPCRPSDAHVLLFLWMLSVASRRCMAGRLCLQLFCAEQHQQAGKPAGAVFSLTVSSVGAQRGVKEDKEKNCCAERGTGEDA